MTSEFEFVLTFSEVFVQTELNSLQAGLLVSVLAVPQCLSTQVNEIMLIFCANVSLDVKAKDVARAGKKPMWLDLHFLSNLIFFCSFRTHTTLVILVLGWSYNIPSYLYHGWGLYLLLSLMNERCLYLCVCVYTHVYRVYNAYTWIICVLHTHINMSIYLYR